MSVQPIHPSELFLVRYVCFLARTLPISSIRGYLDAIKILHNSCGFTFDGSSASFPKLHRVLLGISLKGIPTKACKKAAFGVKELISLRAFCFQFVKFSVQRAAWTAIIVCFWGCIRSDNVVPKQAKLFDPHRHVCLSNIQHIPEGLLVVLKRTKTRSAHSASLQFLLPRLPKMAQLCPVKAVNLLVSIVPGPVNGPLFLYRQGQAVKLLLYRDIRSVIRAWSHSVGVPLAKYGSQSARSGSATTAYKSGVDEVGIMKLGDWLSNTFLSYVKQDMVDLLKIHLKMLNHLEMDSVL